MLFYKTCVVKWHNVKHFRWVIEAPIRCITLRLYTLRALQIAIAVCLLQLILFGLFAKNRNG